jgi:membrane-associated phospholipid phosphatase
MLDTLQTFDASALNAFRSLVNPDSAWQILAIRAFSDIEVAFTAFALVAVWLDARFRKGNDDAQKALALALFYAILFAFALYWVLNFNLPPRPRPEGVSAIRPIIDHLPDNSFPSGHGIFAGASFVAAYFLFRRKGFAIALLCLGIPMLASRVLAGIHYPGDVIVGFFLGAALSAIAVSFLVRPAVRKTALFVWPIRVAKFFGL